MSRWIDADALKGKINTAFWAEIGKIIDEAPSIDIDRPQGKWIEKETFHNGGDEPMVEEWQSAMCSVCHKYHTTPYMYYFNNYSFCPSCGARMKGADDE